MKKWILAMSMALLWNPVAFAAGTQYELRVDGLVVFPRLDNLESTPGSMIAEAFPLVLKA